MSLEKVKIKKEYKKNKKEIWKKEKRREKVEKILCLILVIGLIITPVVIYTSTKSEDIPSAIKPASPAEASAEALRTVTDDDGNKVGHIHEDGTIHMDSETSK